MTELYALDLPLLLQGADSTFLCSNPSQQHSLPNTAASSECASSTNRRTQSLLGNNLFGSFCTWRISNFFFFFLNKYTSSSDSAERPPGTKGPHWWSPFSRCLPSTSCFPRRLPAYRAERRGAFSPAGLARSSSSPPQTHRGGRDPFSLPAALSYRAKPSRSAQPATSNG